MLPLKSDVKIYGALNLYWTRHKEFNEDEKHLLNAIAEMAAIAIEKLRVLEQLEQQVADRTWETRILYELAEISASSADLKSGLTQSLDKILTAVGGQAGTIHLLDDDRTKYEMVVHRGLTSELESDLRSASLEDPFWGRIAEKGEPVLIMNLRAETHVSPALQRSHLKCFLGAPVMVEGIALGIISIFYTLDHNPSLDNIGLLSLVSDQIGLAVERSYLREQARDTVIALERQRLARELHDSVTQSLYSLSFNAKASRNFARAGRWDRVDENLNAVQEIAEQASKEMRLLVYELMPTSLEEQGLISVLEQRLEFVERRSGMDTELVAVGDFDLPTNILASMHRIAEEALNNTLNHASASKIIVRLISRGKRIEMEIEDNGKGFNQSTSPGGMGLQNMHERAKSLGGKLTISSEPDMGTSVRFVIEEVPA
jgi:signal transduction histidine kinase